MSMLSFFISKNKIGEFKRRDLQTEQEMQENSLNVQEALSEIEILTQSIVELKEQQEEMARILQKLRGEIDLEFSYFDGRLDTFYISIKELMKTDDEKQKEKQKREAEVKDSREKILKDCEQKANSKKG